VQHPMVSWVSGQRFDKTTALMCAIMLAKCHSVRFVVRLSRFYNLAYSCSRISTEMDRRTSKHREATSKTAVHELLQLVPNLDRRSLTSRVECTKSSSGEGVALGLFTETGSPGGSLH
jgi:hypothetical protein